MALKTISEELRNSATFWNNENWGRNKLLLMHFIRLPDDHVVDLNQNYDDQNLDQWTLNDAIISWDLVNFIINDLTYSAMRNWMVTTTKLDQSGQIYWKRKNMFTGSNNEFRIFVFTNFYKTSNQSDCFDFFSYVQTIW